MTRKKILLFCTLALAVFGFASATLPFIWSMTPSASAYNKLPHVNLNDMAVGTYKYITPEIKSPYGLLWLIIKKHDNSISVFTVPSYKGKIILPDLNWYRIFGTCNDFRPELENGLVKKGGVITCHDLIEKGWYENEWKWTYNGSNLGKYTEDMTSTRYTIENNILIIGKY